MKASEIRELSRAELETRISEVKKNLFNLKFQKASGQLDNPMKIKNLKKDVAKIETVAREQELGIKVTKPVKSPEKAKEVKKTKAVKEAEKKQSQEEGSKAKTAKKSAKSVKKEKVQE